MLYKNLWTVWKQIWFKEVIVGMSFYCQRLTILIKQYVILTSLDSGFMQITIAYYLPTYLLVSTKELTLTHACIIENKEGKIKENFLK